MMVDTEAEQEGMTSDPDVLDNPSDSAAIGTDNESNGIENEPNGIENEANGIENVPNEIENGIEKGAEGHPCTSVPVELEAVVIESLEDGPIEVLTGKIVLENGVPEKLRIEEVVDR